MPLRGAATSAARACAWVAAGLLLAGTVGCAGPGGRPAAPTATGAGAAPDPFTVAADRAAADWAPAESAALGPGVQTYTAHESGCTANFVFIDAAGEVYLGQAAHCGYLGAGEHPDGCHAATVPLGSPVDLRRDGSLLTDGTTIATGRLAYSSWATMREHAESDPNACAYNDFALIRVPRDRAHEVNPSVPHWGGPTGLDIDLARDGERVFGYGNSSIRGGDTALAPHTGNLAFGASDTGGWNHQVTAFLPAIPGDSGAPYLDARGYALGTLSTLTTAFPARNNLGDLSRELRYAQRHSGIAGLRLVLGTAPFSPD